jgi:hypothetical protein
MHTILTDTRFPATAAALALAGCVSIPLPPTGENAGEWGRLEVAVRYIPNLSAAWSYLRGEQPKPTSTKK